MSKSSNTPTAAVGLFLAAKNDEAAAMCRALEASTKDADQRRLFRHNETVATFHSAGNSLTSAQTLLDAMNAFPLEKDGVLSNPVRLALSPRLFAPSISFLIEL